MSCLNGALLANRFLSVMLLRGGLGAVMAPALMRGMLRPLALMGFAGTSPYQTIALVVAQTIPRVLWFWRPVRCASHHLVIALPTSECLATLLSVRQLCCCFKGCPKPGL